MILEFPAPDPQPPAAKLPWYALSIRPQCEFHVERELGRYKIEAYLPTRTRKHWRNTEIQTPLIPGYVFARGTPSGIYTVLRFTGWFVRLVGTGLYDPIEIPADQIETLKLMVARPKVEVMRLEDVWHGGEEVEITAGALAGSKGRVMMVKGKARLIVSIEMLGRAVSAELDADAVKALAPPAELPEAA